MLEDVGEGAGLGGPETTGKARGGGDAEARPRDGGCFSVPVGEGADGETGAETTEVGME